LEKVTSEQRCECCEVAAGEYDNAGHEVKRRQGSPGIARRPHKHRPPESIRSPGNKAFTLQRDEISVKAEAFIHSLLFIQNNKKIERFNLSSNRLLLNVYYMMAVYRDDLQRQVNCYGTPSLAVNSPTTYQRRYQRETEETQKNLMLRHTNRTFSQIQTVPKWTQYETEHPSDVKLVKQSSVSNTLGEMQEPCS